MAASNWGEPQVNECAAQLGEIAKKAWPYPSLTEAELAPYQKQEDAAPQYTLESYQYLNAFTRMLFEKLNTRILNLATYVKREFKKLYIAYKADTNFVDVVIQSSRLRLAINMKFADVIDPKGRCKDITGVGRWGNGDVEVGLDSLDMLDDVMAIIEQAFRQQDVD
jgi:predicted transport protein